MKANILESPRALVIDDDPGIRTVVRASLKNMGYDVAEAATGEEGIARALETKPVLIVSDVFMAGPYNGYDVLQKLRASPATASSSIIIMTGNAIEADVRTSMELGADDYLLKPFGLQALSAAVEAQFQKRKRRDEFESETESRLLAIFEVTTDLVWIADYRTRQILYMNRSGRALLGVRPEENLANLTFERFHSAEAVDRILTEAIPTAVQKGVWSGETHLRSRDGKTLITSQIVLAHKTQTDEVESLSTIARDITSQKQSELDRNMMEAQLRHAQKLESIGQLAAGIAHEINTPTQYIGDNIRFLLDSFNDLNRIEPLYESLLDKSRDLPEALEEISQARNAVDVNFLRQEIPAAIAQASEGVERVTKLVQAMKDFSHPGSDVKTPTDINRSIDSTLTVCRNEWKYQADLVTDFADDLPQVPCLPAEFNQVVLNLIINAAHAMETKAKEGEKGRLTVSTKSTGDHVEVRVQDTGCGIPEKIRDRIFDPFFTTKGVGRGTGQGLAIARSIIVDKHAGSIAVESCVGEGTTFIVRLPLNSGPAQTETSES